MPNINLDHLATFRLVASRKSFSGAADALGLSQPAVSLQIRQLEQLLKTRLVERTGRGVALTNAGMALLAHVGKIEQAVDGAVQSVAATHEQLSGSVTLGTGATACIHLLPAVLTQLRRLHPALSVRVRTGNAKDILRAVEDNQIDIGLITLPVTARNVHVTPLTEDEFVVITRQGEDLGKTAFTAEDIPLHSLIVFESGSGTRTLIDGWLQKGGQESQPVMELGSIEAIKRMVQAGLGCSIVPAMSVMHPEDREGLQVFPLYPRLFRTVGILMRQDKVVSRALTEVIKLLKE